MTFDLKENHYIFQGYALAAVYSVGLFSMST